MSATDALTAAPKRIKVIKTAPSVATPLDQKSEDLLNSAQPTLQSTQDATGVNEEERMYTFLQALRMEANSDTKQTLTKTTICMVIFPLLTFWLSRNVFFPPVELGGTWTDNMSLTIAGISAVVMVNIVSLAFILYATCWEKDDRIDAPNRPVNFLKSEQEMSLEMEKRKQKLDTEKERLLDKSRKTTHSELIHDSDDDQMADEDETSTITKRRSNNRK